MTLKIVRLWTSNKENCIFVFTGPVPEKESLVFTKIENGEKLTKSDHSLLIKRQISIELFKSSKVTFIQRFLNNDDNMNIIIKKLIVYLKDYIKTDQFYLWAYKHVDKNDAILMNFIHHCFKKDDTIKFKDFREYVKNYFGLIIDDDLNEIDKKIALKILKRLDYKRIIEPILFTYLKSGFFEYIQYDPMIDNAVSVENLIVQSNVAITLGSFGLTSNDYIEMVTFKNVLSSIRDTYFPYKHPDVNIASITKFINILDGKNLQYQSHKLSRSYNIDSYITYMQIRGNDMNYNERINLGILFDKSHTNDEIPFIKYKSSNNVFYKITKKSLNLSSNLEQWTKYKQLYGKMINMTYVVYKMCIGKKSFCTVTLSDTLSYDIKFNINIEEKMTLRVVHEYYSTINKLFTTIRSFYLDSMLVDVDKENVKIINIVTSNILAIEQAVLTYENMNDVVTSEMFPYFNIINTNDKNILLLQYKNVDNYTKYDNIQAFLNIHSDVPKEELKLKLMSTFPMDEQAAETEYTKWKNNQIDVIEEESNKTKFNKYTSYSNFVTVKIKLHNVIDTRFIISGAKNYETLTNLVSLVCYLIDLINQKKKISSPTLDHVLFDKEMFEVLPEVISNPNVPNEYDDLGFLLDNLEEDDLESEFVDKQEPVVIVPKKPNEPIKDKGMYFLNMLKAKDPELFNKMDYARTCQHTAMRQPVVISSSEKKRIDDEFPGAYNDYVHTGSTPDFAQKNIYICPKIWCPKSRVAMTYDQYQSKKCPFEEEKPMFFDKSYWGEDTKIALTKPHYIGFLPGHKHPDGFCLPCCFIRPMKTTKQKCNQNYSEKEIIDDTPEGNEKYVVGENNFPLNFARFGLVPLELLESIGGDKCGRREDGTGLIEVGKTCYLRRGINHGKHSFLSCIVNVLGGTVEQLLDKFIKNMSIERFIGLENGKMIKMFINSTYDINNPDHFKEFVEWFLHPQQKIYRQKYNLMKIELDLKRGLAYGGAGEKRKVKRKGQQSPVISKRSPPASQQSPVISKRSPPASQQSPVISKRSPPVSKRSSKSPQSNEIFHEEPLLQFQPFELKTYPTYKDIVREFLIYNGYKHFLEFLMNDTEIKNHINMLDIINTDTSISKHFIIIDKNLTTNILCPINRNFANVNNPFVFIIKYGQYYEPLCRAELKDSSIQYEYEFNYNSTTKPVKRLINYYINNCGHNNEDPMSLITLIKSLTFNIRAYVIDFGFKVKGILLTNNLYIPFKEKLDTYDVLKNSFIYYNDIVDFKCYEDKGTITDIFKKLKYEIRDFIYDDDKLVACIIWKDTIIPLQLDKKSIFYRTIEDDLDIFIQHEEVDKRSRIIKGLEKEHHVFEQLSETLMTEINKDADLRAEITFLTSKDNPFPKEFRRAKILAILESLAKNKDISFIDKLVEALIIGSYATGSSKIYTVSNNEVLLDQNDVNNKKIAELMEIQRNPYKILTDSLYSNTDEFILNESEFVDVETLLKNTFLENATFNKVSERAVRVYKMDKFQRLHNQHYTPTFIFSIFKCIYKGLNNVDCSIEMLKSIVKTRFIHDFKRKKTDLVNPSMEYIKREVNKQANTLDVYLKVIDNINYFPSIYEIKVLTQLVGINTIIIFRRTNDKEIVYFYNDSPFTLILHKEYDRLTSKDVFQVYVKKNKILFRESDLPEPFIQIVKSKQDQI